MNKLYRFGVSIEKDLIDRFDKHIKEKKYKNRSEAICDLIRNELVKKEWDKNGIVSGAIVMTYNHNKRELVGSILDIQHDFHDIIISTQHVHLTHDLCLEIIAFKGNSKKIKNLASLLQSKKGVQHLNYSFSLAK